MHNLVLIGMRGSGKTNLGRQIAKTIKRPFIDIDKEIERQEGRKIRQIIDKKGWFYFRKIEKYIVRKIANKKGVVIATGGGTIIDPENQKKLEKHGIFILLEATPETLAKRLENGQEMANRPSLTEQENLLAELNEIWQKRQQAYTDAASFRFEFNDDSTDPKKDIKVRSKQIIETIALDYPEFEKPELTGKRAKKSKMKDTQE